MTAGRSIVFQWLDPCPNDRLRQAQARLAESVRALGLEPVLYPAGPAMVKFHDILRFARERSVGESFVWCNSDLTLRANPYDFDDGHTVHGFHRREVPSGEFCGGVDMYLIPHAVWDSVYANDLPDLWCGATHVDWWLTKAAELAGCYDAHFGCIDHVSHPESGASKGRGNPFYRHNVREYNRWARRRGAVRFECRVELPFIGASPSPITDYLRRASQVLGTKRLSGGAGNG